MELEEELPKGLKRTPQEWADLHTVTISWSDSLGRGGDGGRNNYLTVLADAKTDIATLVSELATLRSDNERLTDIEDQMREAWKWLRARDLVDDLDDEWDGFTAVLDHHEAEICEQAERAVARAEAAEAERDTLLAQVGEMRGAINGIYIYANDTLSGRADGGPDDRAWQRAAVVEIRNRARVFATVQSAVDARAALTKEPS